jgi:glycosyltransferase involved in cell wall biosynthesis
MPSISVIIPVYKVECYLRQCVDSVLSQTYNNFEVILVDDGSPDACPQICDDYANQDSRVRVIHKQNQGLMQAWMDGLKIATAEWIMFVDSDDWIDSEMLAAFMDKQQETGAEMIVQFLGEKKKIYLEVYDRPRLNSDFFPNMFYQRGAIFSRCGKLIQKSLLADNLNYCNASIFYGEDMNIMFPVFLDVNHLCVINNSENYYHYRLNTGSITKNHKQNMYCQVKRLYQILLQAAKDKRQNVLDESIEQDYLITLDWTIRNALRSPKLKTALADIVKIRSDEILQKSKCSRMLLKLAKSRISPFRNTVFAILWLARRIW